MLKTHNFDTQCIIIAVASLYPHLHLIYSKTCYVFEILAQPYVHTCRIITTNLKVMDRLWLTLLETD